MLPDAQLLTKAKAFVSRYLPMESKLETLTVFFLEKKRNKQMTKVKMRSAQSGVDVEAGYRSC